jgi:hypothetical protein
MVPEAANAAISREFGAGSGTQSERALFKLRRRGDRLSATQERKDFAARSGTFRPDADH